MGNRDSSKTVSSQEASVFSVVNNINEKAKMCQCRARWEPLLRVSSHTNHRFAPDIFITPIVSARKSQVFWQEAIKKKVLTIPGQPGEPGNKEHAEANISLKNQVSVNSAVSDASRKCPKNNVMDEQSKSYF